MCGIAGVVRHGDVQKLSAELAILLEELTHRGPDGSGCKVIDNVGFGHRRLAIIDIKDGQQPMTTPEGDIWVTLNGEIYNYRELRAGLEVLGHQFRTHSDTEVLLYGYRAWGIGVLDRLRGMFAFAIVDVPEKKVLLARDPFGIKPLVYYRDKERFAFASEIGALRQLPGFRTDIDYASIDQYLGFGYITAPDTAYRSVKKLPPAHYLEIGFDGVIRTLRRYWRLTFRPDNTLTEQDWLECLDTCIRNSVRAHLVADVPFGVFLSGGVDSSLVTGYMAELLPVPVKTFSIGFEHRELDETPYARQVAARWQTEHHEEIVHPDALGLLPELVRHYGEPFGDSSAIPTWYVSRLARRHVTMVLGGDGGDELFAGYQAYTDLWAKQITPIPYHLPLYKRMAYPMANLLRPSRYPYRKSDFGTWFHLNGGRSPGPSALWHPEISATIAPSCSQQFAESFEANATAGHFQKAQAVDFEHYLPADILTKVDVASMMHSLEVRTPLLDTGVLEVATRIPEAMNIQRVNGHYSGKRLLKGLLARRFPRSFVDRPKQGFAVPMNDWLAVDSRKWQAMSERLSDPGGTLAKFFTVPAIKSVLTGRYKESMWRLMFLDEWLRQQDAIE